MTARDRRKIFLKYLLTIILLMTAVCAGVNASASPAEADSSDAPIQAGRNWTITLPVWIPGFRGEFTVGDVEVEGENPGGGGGGFLGRFFESKLRLNFFFIGAFSYERNRWRVHGDVFGGKFTDDVVFKLTDGTVASATVQPIIPTLHAAYRVYEHPWGDSGHQQVRASVYGGLRIYDVRVEVEVATLNEGIDNTWADPIVGVWVPVDLSRRWFVEVSADVGGFDLGSKFSWNMRFDGAYRAGRLVTMSLGYNFLSIDYRGNVASKDFVYDVQIGGPLAGIRFNF